MEIRTAASTLSGTYWHRAIGLMRQRRKLRLTEVKACRGHVGRQ